MDAILKDRKEDSSETARIPSDSIRRQLGKIGNSRYFSGSGKLTNFLEFVVTETLGGRGGSLKEAVIGNVVYGREPAYDPRIDSTVRVEARRLRRKLEQYYADEGRGDGVRISIPKGGYVPVFSDNVKAEADSNTSDETIFKPGAGAAVVVMPFGAGPSPEEQYLADAFTDELIFLLVGEQGFRVVSRTATQQQIDRGMRPAEIARDLDACGAMQGVIRKNGGQIRLTAEYMDLNGFVLISDRMCAPANEPETAIRNLALTFVSRLRIDNSKMRNLLISPQPEAIDAHSKIYRARQLLDGQTGASVQEALRIFTDVRGNAPDYARGHSGVSDAYCDLFRLGLVEQTEALTEAKPAALRALEIDSDSIEAHTALANVLACLERDNVAAEREYLKALSLARNARTARRFAFFLARIGRFDEAEVMLRMAREIEPLSKHQDLAEALLWYQMRRFELLNMEIIETRSGKPPTELLAYFALGRLFAGDLDGASMLIPALEIGGAIEPDLMLIGAEIEARCGDRRRGRNLLADSSAGPSGFSRAALAAALEDTEQAIDELRFATQHKEPSLCWLPTDMRFDLLRHHPEFQQIVNMTGPTRVH